MKRSRGQNIRLFNVQNTTQAVRIRPRYDIFINFIIYLNHKDLKDRAIVQTVRVLMRSQFRSCELYGGQNGRGAGFLEVFRFPLPIPVPVNAPQSLIIPLSTSYSLVTENAVE
jgi:hypothetical protein